MSPMPGICAMLMSLSRHHLRKWRPRAAAGAEAVIVRMQRRRVESKARLAAVGNLP